MTGQTSCTWHGLPSVLGSVPCVLQAISGIDFLVALLQRLVLAQVVDVLISLAVSLTLVVLVLTVLLVVAALEWLSFAGLQSWSNDPHQDIPFYFLFKEILQRFLFKYIIPCMLISFVHLGWFAILVRAAGRGKLL